MTDREKAIIYFKDMRKRFCEDYLSICPKDSTAYKATLAEKEFYDTAIEALESESRMSYVQETVNAILNTCDTDSIADKAMRNAARFVQNAIDGSCPDFEELPKMGRCKYCISREAVLKAIDAKAWEFCDYLISKGRNDEQKPVSHFADNLRECVGEDLPSVTPQPEPGYISIEDAMSAFDDFMRGDADENETEVFLEMLKDRAERSEVE